MDRKIRLKLNKIAPCFIGYRNVVNWYIDNNDVLWVETKNNIYSAKRYFGTYGFITRHC